MVTYSALVLVAIPRWTYISDHDAQSGVRRTLLLDGVTHSMSSLEHGYG
jgi:hypothetical protein